MEALLMQGSALFFAIGGTLKHRDSHLLKSRKKVIGDLIRSKNYIPMREKEIAALLQIPRAKRADLARVLDILEQEGRIYQDAKGRYHHVAGADGRSRGEGNRKREKGKHVDSRPEGIAPVQAEPGAEITAVVRAYGISEIFPERVQNQANRCPDGPVPGDFSGRLDLRDWLLVTIDGEDARDLDDAVSLSVEDGLYRLGVHIADVSNYVQENSALDREALKRGTSVYLADRVIPMLPRKLSNGTCSLNAGEDRLALSCIMYLNAEGIVVRSRIAETVIRVSRRLSYPEVDRYLTQDDPVLAEEYGPVGPMLRQMWQLSRRIRAGRRARGAIDFDFPEPRIVLGEDGRPTDIIPEEANEASRLIEDFMLAANETVAEKYFRRGIPFLYRTHEKPDGEKMESALKFIRSLGIPVDKKRQAISPKEVQEILDRVKGKPQEAVVSRILLRSMKQARYTTECVGHYGLAAKYYCHFTSPIRRYPDLQIHRIIKDDLRGRLQPRRLREYRHRLEDVAWKTSALERRAVEVERETDKVKMAEYMLSKLGEEYRGVISGVTDWGFYVELDNMVEGLVHIMTLRDDYYEYDEEHYRLCGRDTGRVFSLGQPVTIRVKSADPDGRVIDFELADPTVRAATGEASHRHKSENKKTGRKTAAEASGNGGKHRRWKGKRA